ncbi:MAG: hypothetical protein HOC74_10315 [Gemmatimonadetes bacterium]|nr:hypothetical protein [Gemmatimonadota bacterium]
MALDTTSVAQEWIQLLEVADVTIDGTPSQTWRISDRNIALSDDTFYRHRLRQVPPITLSAGRLIQPRLVSPDITLVIDDSDDAVRTIIDANNGLAGKVFTLKLGQGKTAGNYQTRFTGTVQFPGGIQWGDQTVIIRLDNALETDSVTMPPNKFFTSDYPDVEAKSEFLPFPVVYGDFRTTAGNGETVPCFMIEEVATRQYKFKIADHQILEIEAVYRNGVDITGEILSSSTALAEFTWGAPVDDDYDPDVDGISANINGKLASTFVAGRYGTPAVVARDIIVSYMGRTNSDIDLLAFTEWDWSTGPDEMVRRWIGTEAAASTYLAELMDEAFWDLLIDADGVYTVKPRWATGAADDITFREADIAIQPNGSRDFHVERDPERTFANQVVADHLRRPGLWDGAVLSTEAIWAATLTLDDTDSQTAVGQTRRYRLKLSWVFSTSGATDRAQRHLMAFAQEVEMLNTTLGPGAVTLFPGDQFQLIYSKYEILSTLGTPFMVRDVAPHIETMLTQVRAWNLDDFSAKRYQADGSASWTGGATAYAKEVDGFYADANGEADPGDATSGGQVYF